MVVEADIWIGDTVEVSDPVPKDASVMVVTKIASNAPSGQAKHNASLVDPM